MFIVLIFLLCSLLSLLFREVKSGQVNSPGATSSFSPGGQYIMITFDDGPHFSFTAQVLDILKTKKVKATFFLSGHKGMHHADLIRRIQDEKHDIGNRGWTNAPITKLPMDQLTAQINSTSQLLSNITKVEVKYYRPPGGLTNAHINSHIKDSMKMRTILWSLDSRDSEAGVTAEKIRDNVLTKAKPGDVVRLHDTLEVAVQALPSVIDGLYAQGYEFLTLSQVISFPDDSPH